MTYISKYGMTKVLSHGEGCVAFVCFTPKWKPFVIMNKLNIKRIASQGVSVQKLLLCIGSFSLQNSKVWSVVMHVIQWQVIGKWSASCFEKFLQAYGVFFLFLLVFCPRLVYYCVYFRSSLQMPYLVSISKFQVPSGATHNNNFWTETPKTPFSWYLICS